jgi:hypothetical protein
MLSSYDSMADLETDTKEKWEKSQFTHLRKQAPELKIKKTKIKLTGNRRSKC